MEQSIRKTSQTNINETREAFVEFLKRINQKKISIISFAPDQIVFRDEEGKTRKIIKIGNRFIETKEVSDKITSPNFNNTKKNGNSKKKNRKAKSRRGRIISRNAKKILAPVILSTGILASAFTLAHEEPANTLEVTIVSEPIETLEELEETNIIITENDALTMNNCAPNSEEQMVISQTTAVEVMPKENMIKRSETDYQFGTIIDMYTSRYGIPSAIGKALLTQERPNEGYENVGQLTRNVCGEKIILPIINGNAEENKKGVEKIYIIRDEPQRSSFEEESSYREEMERYKNQLEESKQLANEGYQIYYFETAMQDVELNIHLSMAYLAYCVYKCDMTVNQGIRGYNCGYPLSRCASDEEIAGGKIEVGDPNYNQNVFSYLYPNELNELVWYLKSVPKIPESEAKKMTLEEIQKREYELAEDAPLVAISMDFTRVRNLEYAQENGYNL